METTENKVREPLFHIAKRAYIPWYKAWCIRLIAILAAFIICGILSFIVIGASPLDFYSALLKGSLGSQRKIWKFLKDAAVLLCISLAVTPAFRMKFWNIGAEGQTLMGALATAACMFYLGGKLPDAIGIPEEELRQAAKLAVCKINIDSDIRLAMTAGIRRVMHDQPEVFDPRTYLSVARDEIRKLVVHKITDVLGSANTL